MNPIAPIRPHGSMSPPFTGLTPHTRRLLTTTKGTANDQSYEWVDPEASAVSKKFFNPLPRLEDALWTDLDDQKQRVVSAVYNRDLRAVHAHENFEVRVLVGTVDGKPRRLVFVGEDHFMTDAEFELALSLLKHWDTYALENSAAENIFSKIHNRVSYALFKKFAIWQSQSSSKEVRRYRSLITQAYLEAPSGHFLEILVAQSQELWHKEGFDRLTDAELSKIELTTKFDYQDAKREIELSALDLKNIVVHGDTTALTSGKTDVDLETGHQPDFFENLAHAYPTALAMLGAYAVLGAPTLLYSVPQIFQNPVVASLLIMPGAIGVALLWSYIIGMALKDKLPPRSPLQLLLSPYYFGLTYGRDTTMVKNLLAHLNTRPELQEILIGVGGEHVAGQVKLLTENHGFVDITADVLW